MMGGGYFQQKEMHDDVTWAHGQFVTAHAASQVMRYDTGVCGARKTRAGIPRVLPRLVGYDRTEGSGCYFFVGSGWAGLDSIDVVVWYVKSEGGWGGGGAGESGPLLDSYWFRLLWNRRVSAWLRRGREVISLFNPLF